MTNKTKEKFQKGVASIYIAMMIMIVSLGIVLGLTVIFIGHLRIIRGMGNSVVAFYAANSGMERLLYEDKLCRARTAPCAVPCHAECHGLASPSTFSGTLANGATYRARFSIVDGREHLESLGTFEGARRAIRVTR